MPDGPVEVTDLCDQREPDGAGWWVCTEALGHDDGGWHYDPVEGRWWKRTRTHVMSVPDPDHRPHQAAGQRKETSMQPTVGRVVHVLMDPKHNNGADVAPAIITRVWNEHAVNVRVLRDGYPDDSEWMTSISVHESREALEDHIAEIQAVHPQSVISVRGAFWPPVHHAPKPSSIAGDTASE